MRSLSIIAGTVLFVALAGSWFTMQGITSGWYASIAKPSWMPPGSVFGFVWTLIFLLCVAGIHAFWKNRSRYQNKQWIIALFIVNGVLNIGWCFSFFFMHQIEAGLFVIALLEATVVGIILMTWRSGRVTALLFLPYAFWVVFAFFLNYAVWIMNLNH